MASKQPKVPVTDVHFRMDERECVAIFPGEPGTNDPYTCTCYSHVGQHASCDPMAFRKFTTKATEDQWKDLYAELVGRGYRLRVIDRIGAKYLDIRRAALAGFKAPPPAKP